MFPFSAKNPKFGKTPGQPSHIPVPCGSCTECLKRRANGWIFRLKEEFKISDSAYFLTLTYSNKTVPITGHGFLTLDKKHVQDFMKRLRKRHEKSNARKIKYYAVGEYGSTTKRPHYHIVLFNALIEHIEPSWSVYGDQIGNVHIGNVEPASIAYTVKYIMKGKTVPCHERDDRLPEFSLMSKGLGKSYISDDMKKWHKADLDRNYCVVEGGIKVPLPRYYREKVYDEDERNEQAKRIQKRQRDLDDERREEFYEEYGYDANYEKWRFHQKEYQLKQSRKNGTNNRNKI